MKTNISLLLTGILLTAGAATALWRETMKHNRYVLAKLLMIIFSVIAITEANIVVRKSYDQTFGYGGGYWGTMSAMLDEAYGGSITPLANLEASDQVLNADALWIDKGGTTIDVLNGGSNVLLSATEIHIVQNFIAAGKRVVIFGDNNSYNPNWNNQIAGLVGVNRSTVNISGLVTTALDHELTVGVSSIRIPFGGQSIGGKALFNPEVASLYGPLDNVLVVLDVNMFDIVNIRDADNSKFAQNIANWVAIPEPSSVAMFSLVCGCAVFVRRLFVL